MAGLVFKLKSGPQSPYSKRDKRMGSRAGKVLMGASGVNESKIGLELSCVFKKQYQVN